MKRQRDKDKLQFCIDNDIKLIIIPYTENNRLEEYITIELKKAGII